MPAVLVVEDESAIAELIAINLRHAGFEVTLAENADQAQMAVDAVLPDLVLLDWMLPGQSGVALARRWRGEARTKELDRKSTRLNSSHIPLSRMPSSA